MQYSSATALSRHSRASGNPEDVASTCIRFQSSRLRGNDDSFCINPPAIRQTNCRVTRGMRARVFSVNAVSFLGRH